jgi:hypothetical protein
MQEKRGWVMVLMREVLAMPRRHLLVFLLATVLLIIVQVEVVQGWHLVHLFELLGVMLILYLGWATWRIARLLK